MFNSIKGSITFKGSQRLFLENNGIEWDMIVPDTCLEKLGRVGDEARLFTWLQHTDSAMTLYGFSSESQRELFFSLVKVDGIGPKGAIKIMSNVSAESLCAMLDAGDVASLSKVSGVGKKAGKMILSLKGKLSLEQSETIVKKSNSPFEAVILSLADMGYDRRDAEAVIDKLVKDFFNDETFSAMLPTQKEDFLFRRAIVELAR